MDMSADDRHSKTYRSYQSVLLLALVVLLMLQTLFFVGEFGHLINELLTTGQPLRSWRLYYSIVTTVLFIVGVVFTAIGIRGTTNESHSSIRLFSYGTVITIAVKTLLSVFASDYRLTPFMAIYAALHLIAVTIALLFARRMVSEIKAEPLTESME